MANIKQRRTFISYSRTNKDFALKLSKELRTSGFNIWLDLLDIPTGSRWDDEVEKALESCEIFMVILTPASSASDNVKDEIGYAIDTGKHILPVLLENAKVPLRLRRFQYVDFTSKSYKEGVESAKQLLRSLIEEQTVPRREFPASTQAQSVEEDHKAKDEAEHLAAQKAEAGRLIQMKAMAERTAGQQHETSTFAVEREKVEKASALMRQAKQLLQNGALPEAVQVFRQILTLMPHHEETLTLVAKAEEAILQERESSDRKAKEESKQLAKQKAEREAKAEEERLAKAKVEADRKAKEEADRLAAQKAEAERVAKQKAEEERLAKAKAETERKVKLEADRLAAQQAEEKSKAKPAPVMPAEMKAETVSATTTQKRSISRGLVIGVIAIVVLAIAGVGLGLTSQKGNSNSSVNQPATEVPAVENPATEVPVVENPATEVTTASSVFIPETSACETPTASVKVKNVYLRDGPDIRFVALAQYKNGDQFTLLGRYRDWFQAEAADGKKGWVYKDWVTIPSTLDTSTICSIPVEELPPTPQDNQQNDQRTPQNGDECVPTYYVSCP